MGVYSTGKKPGDEEYRYMQGERTNEKFLNTFYPVVIGNELNLKRPAQLCDRGPVSGRMYIAYVHDILHGTADTHEWLRDGEGRWYEAHWISEDKRRWQRRARVGGIRI